MAALELVFNISKGKFKLILPIVNGTITKIDWGDNSTSKTPSHTYTKSGIYKVSILGKGITSFDYGSDGVTGAQYLSECTSFGEIGLTDLSGFFYGAITLTTVPTVLPEKVTNVRKMFFGAAIFNQDISGWDVSNVEDMSNMFYNARNFNQDIGNWNVSNVTDMNSMFYYAVNFNQDISSWNVSNVTDMSYMFQNASVFNQNIGTWDFSRVKNIDGILNNSGLTVETYNATLQSLASSITLPSGLTFGGSSLVYSPAGKKAHETLSLEKGLIFDGDAFISTNVIQKNVPFDFVVNTGTSFLVGDYTFPTNQSPGYPASQTYTLETVPGEIPYKKLIFKITGTQLQVTLSGPTVITYYLTIQD